MICLHIDLANQKLVVAGGTILFSSVVFRSFLLTFVLLGLSSLSCTVLKYPPDSIVAGIPAAPGNQFNPAEGSTK